MKESSAVKFEYDKLEGCFSTLRQKKYIGKGRSAKVYLSYCDENAVVTKSFTGELVSKIILFLLTGSANPYTWCENAIHSAVLRRRILKNLCKYWFNDSLRLPNTYSYRWNKQEKAFEIDMEYIAGKHAPLFNPLRKHSENYISELKSKIMKPLQDNLIRSGFEGAVWQAGKGNPVAISNFMMTKNENNSRQWIWIDLESGLPALFAMNPFSTLFYYLPKSIKYRSWLFDNVDIKKLNTYLKECKSSLIFKLGINVYQDICNDSDLLFQEQKKWYGLSRHQRSLYYAVSQDKISKELKEFYENRPFLWFFKNLLQLLKGFIHGLKRILKDSFNAIINFRFKKLVRRVFMYSTDARYRWEFIRWYLKKEINEWESRKFLDETESRFLKTELKNDDISSYLTDFSIHIGIKPFVKFFTLVIVPILMAFGIFSLQTGAIIIIGAGPLARTVYTLWRITHGLVVSKSHFPLLALLIGVLPVIGNLAYPVELLYWSTKDRDVVAKFIFYSFSAKLGTKIPIWGGKDSEIEHFFNKMCHQVLN